MYENIVIEGGGIKNMACLGSVKFLEEKGYLTNLKRYAGSSAGSMMSLLLLIGFTPDEIFQKMITTNFRKYMLTNPLMYPYNLIFKYGLNNGNKIIGLIGDWMQEKNIDRNITFKQLFQQTQKTLVVTGTNISKRKVVYFNPNTHPLMKVLDAIRASINIPFFFTSVCIDNDYYIDGGVLMNFPLYYFDEIEHEESTKTIGILTQDVDTDEKHPSYYASQSIDNIVEYMVASGYTVFQSIEKNYIKDNYWNRVIPIQLSRDIKITEFKLSKDVMYELFNVGYTSAVNFFSPKPLENELE